MNYVYVGIISFLVGVVVRSVFIFDTLLPFVFFFSTFIFFVLVQNSSYEHKKLFSFCAVVLVFMSLGMIRVEIDESKRTYSLDEKLNTHQEFIGVVESDIEHKANYTRFVLNEGEENILVYGSPLLEVTYGDILSVRGVLKKPEVFLDERGDTFNWPRYLAKDDIYYELFFPHVENRGKGNLSLFQDLKRWLFVAKRSFIDNVRQVVPEPEASLLVGEVVGEKSSLGDELEASLRRTGIIHVVVLSGYNVTIVADSIIRSLSFVPRVLSLYLGIGGIILFALLTGGSATVVRASIMAILVILARRYGRVYDITTALLVAGFLMVLQAPDILLYDPSFQLSFLATLGLIYVAPHIENYFKFLPKRFGIREVVGATIGTQIFVLPMLVYLVGQVSFVSLPVNLLVLPVIPLTMLVGFVTGVVGYLSYSLSLVVGYGATLLLSYQLFIVSVFDGAWSAVSNITLSPWIVIIFYTILLAYFLRKSRM